MRVAISGSSGLIGSALVSSLRNDGHSIVHLVRPGSPRYESPAPEDAPWDPATGTVDLERFEGVDSIVNLAGASIGESRWTHARRELLRSSRIETTRSLVSICARLPQKPLAFICASAVGYYGDRGDEVLTESSAPGGDFLAQLCRDWEAEAERAAEVGIRTVRMRFGIVLGEHGGALQRMLGPFKLGVGGTFGTGSQWMSWITLDDAIALLRYALEEELLHGAVNAVAPNPVRNAQFTAVLASLLHRPAIFPAPRPVMRMVLGEMADALLFASQRVIPQKLDHIGYRFFYPELREALMHVLRID